MSTSVLVLAAGGSSTEAGAEKPVQASGTTGDSPAAVRGRAPAARSPSSRAPASTG